MAFEPPPNERLDELMETEEHRQGAQRDMGVAPVTVQEDVDPNSANYDPADEICLRREAHRFDPTPDPGWTAGGQVRPFGFQVISGAREADRVGGHCR